jgi:peptidoglycan/LPS O-acetylase OafA/YrhL
VGADDTTDTDTDSASESAARTQTTSADLTRLIDDVEDVLRGEPAPVEASPAVVVRRKPAWQTRKLGYQPGLDGLRAVAVGLVIAYHLGYSRAAGGYIGVELFFVLSGWLVCALLINEHQRTDGIAVRDFWVRRARRLLPGVAVVVAGTLAWATAFRPERLAELRDEAAAALGYHLNWRLIVDHKSYFEAAGGPSALDHLWSLSIEEQFYLLFPLLCGLVLVRVGRKRAVVIALAGAVAATVLRFALAGGGDLTRLYFGTDTRAAGLLAGVALGLFWTPNRLRPHGERMFVAVLDAVAVAAALVVGWYAFGLSDRDGAAFRSGLTAVQLATLALIAVVVYPAPTRTARLLAASPLRWVGQRSYGIYLIHWPVIVFTATAPGEQPESPLKVAAQVALVLGLAAASYRWIEQPVRHRGFGDAGRDALTRLARAVQGRSLPARATAVTAVVGLAVLVSVGQHVMTATAPEAAQPARVMITAAAPTTTGVPTTPAPTTAAAPAVTPVTTAPATTVPPPPPAPPGVPGGFTAIGDSVLVGAGPALWARLGGGITVDAVIGRQMDEAADVVRSLDAQGLLGHVVLLHLGNNGPFTEAQIEDVLAAIGPDRQVMLVNVMVPRRWEGDVNNSLEAAVARHPNTRLVDWWSLVTSESGLTREDGYHLTAAGAERFTDLVVGQIPTA